MVQAAPAEQLTELEYEKCTDINLKAQICTQNIAPAALVCHFGTINNKLFRKKPQLQGLNYEFHTK